ncbi:PREDICTED: alpha-protein kinase 3 isoform X3 [Hipposideros armiger]|uniref:Alpha-protein kinase 3 n=1 Tax=Hipposideros armiger TaxID=186990 RepID=A0A8B7R7C9_HIPAR|nr:PREDICTED: alpha-protein kinase 3 isoform X3 [Hipposideros armiger]
MGSRRVPSRSWGAGGRAWAGGDGEDDGPVWTPSPASRSYLLSVRPETSLSSSRLSHPSSGRSTFCSIIAQLTEETQPLFETTLKSRAVSEDSDVKFTCVVTGYPEPEVTWYKDDMELDRYCGLPKYEITHQGNRHTLQLYKCREEDAAIYQASARNTKGIVSCSGVLEVGTMTEYKIHQRWFAKLKQKAAAKMREIEQSWKPGKEVAGEADTLRKLSPDRFQRKRRLSGAEVPVPSAPTREAEDSTPVAWQERGTEPGQHAGSGLMNSFAPGEVTTNGDAAPENGEDAERGLLTYICEAMELGSQRTPKKESGAKKKKKDEELKPGLRKPESEKTARGHRSENCVPSSDKPDSCGTLEPMDMEVQTRPRGRAAQGPGSSGVDSTRKPASAVGSPDQAQNAPAPGSVPGPDQEVYFSLKDMYLESTRAARPQGEEVSHTSSGRAPGEMPSGKVPREVRGERGPATPGQPMPSAPQSTRPFNRKRFAPPKPKEEPTTTSTPDSSLSQAPESGAQSLGKAPPQVSAQVPTPPARRRHSTLQGQAGRRTPGEVPESQATMAPTILASSSTDAASAAGSTPKSQGVIEPMDTEIQESRRTCADGQPGGKKNTEADGKMQLSSTEMSGAGMEAQRGAAPGGPAPSGMLASTVEVAGLSPRTSRRILERVENNHLVQSAQNLLLSPCTSRRLTGLLDREVQASRQALAATRCPGPSPLTVPAIVVGEEEGPGLVSEGPGEGEGEGPLEEPGLLGTSQESIVEGQLREAGGQTASGQGPLSAESRAQEPFQEEEILGEAPTCLPAATPEELALGARRKRFLPKVRAAGDGEVANPEERESPTLSPRGPRKGLSPGSPGTPGQEKRSPTQGRKAGLLEVPQAAEKPAAEDLGSSPKASGQNPELGLDEGKQETPAKPKKAQDLLKAPQVIRKIRAEQFPDASGSLKLWCQFFNILSDSVLTWAKDQRPVGEVGRSAGDEGPAALAIVQASPVDCGVYRCTIHNEHGSASTDFCLSPEVLSGFISREEGEVGEEIEMTPMVFAKGLADSGCWGDKLFGRLVSEELRGGGCGYGLRKASQAKVIYGLEPIFESGRTCVIKVFSLLVFGPSSETSLVGRNYDVTIQGCKIQNMSREYCKIFAAEARAVSGFGEVPEIIPLYLIYRPANNIPYATLEEDLGKPLEPYCSREWGRAAVPAASSSSEAVQKCQTFQHWLYLWTNGSFLVTDVAGVEWKMTDVQIATKLRGYQGLKESCFPALLDQFASSHQCNTFCEMLGLKPLKGPEAAHPQAKAKGSKSPSAGRKGPQLSPQPQKKGLPSPQGTRKSAPSSKATPQASGAVATQLLGQPPIQEGGSKAQGTR